VNRFHAPALAAVTLAVCLLVSARPLNIYDEGLALYEAERVLRGEIPYRDFWTNYGPAQSYVLAAWFGLLGPSVLVERVWDAAAKAALTFAFHRLAILVLPARQALLATTVAILWLGPADPSGYPMYPALAASLGSAVCLIEFRSRLRTPWILSSGLLAGVAGLFRQDIGVYTFLAGGILLLASHGHGRPEVPGPGGIRPGASARALAWYLLGAGALIVPAGLYFLCHVEPPDLWRQLVEYPVLTLPPRRRLAYPALIPDLGRAVASLRDGFPGVAMWTEKVWYRWLAFYLPPGVCLWAALDLGWRTGKRGAPSQGSAQPWAVALLVALGALFFLQTLSRFDPVHALPASLPTTILLTRLVSQVVATARRIPVTITVAVLVLGVGAGWVAAPAGRLWATAVSSWPPSCPDPMERQGCARLEEGQARTVAFLRARTSLSDPIFSGVSTHDRVFASDVALYFLSGRRSATKYHIMPGLATEADIQREIVEDLERARVRYLVLYSGFEDHREPNLSSVSSGVFLLDDFIRDRFRPVARYGDYSILERR